MRLRWVLALALGALAALAQLAPAAAQSRRVALVIGNGSYAKAGIPTAASDAEKLGLALTTAGYDVTLGQNMTRGGMEQALTVFGRKLTPGATAVVYYLGHGVQANGVNVLLPVDANPATADDLRTQGFGLETLLDRLIVGRPATALVVLDTGFSFPLGTGGAAARGLAVVRVPPATAMLYAAPVGVAPALPGSGGSRLAAELTRAMAAPGLSANKVAVQVRAAATPPGGVPAFIVRQEPEGPPVSGPPGAAAPPPPPAASAPVAQADTSRDASLLPAAEGATKDCETCPELVAVRPGSFQMGGDQFDFEKPVHGVTISRPFMLGRKEVTFAEWDACVDGGGCQARPSDRGLGRGDRPVTDISWADAKEYVAWLSRTTGKSYRLPTEAEWEYAGRAGTTTTYPWGAAPDKDRANCLGCSSQPVKHAVASGQFPANAWGLLDMPGNAAEWVEDCWSETYKGAPADGSAWTKADCRERVLRGGSFNNDPRYLRSGARFKYDSDVRYFTNGLRVARDP
jgi:formylglycine-generating enzyme required for sulfatase activity